MNKIFIAMSTLALTGAMTACQNGLDTKGDIIEKPDVQIVDGKTRLSLLPTVQKSPLQSHTKVLSKTKAMPKSM